VVPEVVVSPLPADSVKLTGGAGGDVVKSLYETEGEGERGLGKNHHRKT